MTGTVKPVEPRRREGAKGKTNPFRQSFRPLFFFAPSRLRGSILSLTVAGVVIALALTAAYQVRPVQVIEVGDAAHDTALLRGFYGPERQSAADGGRRYRWTRDTGEVVFPGLGRGPVRVELTLNRDANPNDTVRVLANGGELTTLTLLPRFSTYTIDVPAAYLTSGNLTLALRTTPFASAGDPSTRRTLGVVVSRVVISPQSTGFALPPARVALALWLGVMGVALGLLVAGLGPVSALIGAAVTAGALAFGLVVDRAFVTTDAGGIAAGGAAMIAVAALVRLAVPPLCRWRGLAVTARDVPWLAAIVAGVIALRLAGSLHPAIAVVDLRFHLNRLSDVVDHHTLLLRIVSAEAGGREVLYAPTPYLVLWPLTVLVRNRALLLVLFAGGIDAARFCVLWAVTRATAGENRTANLTAATMAAMPVGWIVYSWGIYANIFAEGMLTLLFALLVLSYRQLAGRRRGAWTVLFALVICLTLLAHLGVLVLTAAVVALYGLARLVEAVAVTRRGDLFARFALAGVVAAVLAFALFYRFPVAALMHGAGGTPTETATATTALTVAHGYLTGGATPDDRIGLNAVQTDNFAVALALEAWFNARAFYGVWPILAALVGGALLARRGWRAQFARLGSDGSDEDASGTSAGHAWDAALTIGIWLVVVVVMLVVGLVGRLYVRYPLFALPAVALGAGVALAALARRGLWGQLVVAVLLIFSVASSLLLWYDRIVYAFKPAI